MTEEERFWLEKRCPYLSSDFLDFLERLALRPSEQAITTFVPVQEGSYLGDIEIGISGKWAEVILYEVR